MVRPSPCENQLSLGKDFVLSDYVGNMGFDECVTWSAALPPAS